MAQDRWPRRTALQLGLGVGAGLVAGCAVSPQSSPSPTPAGSGTTSSPVPAAPTPTFPDPTPTATITASPIPSPTLPPVRHEPSLPVLMRRTYASAAPERRRTMLTTDAYRKYAVHYRSGELTVSGVLYVPRGNGPFPGIVLNHGYIEPSRYVTGQGMAPEQAFLAERGFVVLHTDYRGHATSSPAGQADRELRLGYAEDALHAARALQAMTEVDADRVAMFGRSMGGGVTMNALVSAPGAVRAGVIWASVSSAFVDNLRQFTFRSRPEAAADLERRYGPVTQDNTFYADLSPRSFFDRITEPVLIEHGTADSTCPIGWARDTNGLMRDAAVDVRLIERPGEQHAYGRAWKAAMEDTYAFLRQRLSL